MSKLSRKAMDTIRLTIGTVLIIGMIIGAILLVGGIAAPQETTYSNDHFTVAESSDGESVLVTYEVETSLSDAAELGERRNRMNELAEVSACSNARLDEYIEANTESKVENANLQEIVTTCETSDVEVSDATATDSLK